MAEPVGQVLVRYFASARAASGVREEPFDGATLAEVLRAVGQQHGDRMAAIIAASSVLVDGRRVVDPSTPLREGAELDVLPPFAGG